MRTLDKLVDGITMYRLLIYYLIALLVAAVGLSIAKDLHYNPFYIAISTAILVVSCWAVNRIFAAIFTAPTNPESSIITALILALIITPLPTGYNITFMIAASGLAIASKYILTIHKKHIFNPAAVAVALTALGPRQTASWWVGTAVMLPAVIIGGILITRKLRREKMLFVFLLSTTLATVVYAIIGKTGVGTGLHDLILNSPVFFLGFVMLTEPLTSPVTSEKQSWYAVIVGALFPPQAHILKYYTSPEIALLAGNVFSYFVSPKTKLFPVLKQKMQVASNTLDFVFDPGRKFTFKPGQYMEFTLPHDDPDSRGVRRYFTIASSPTEPDLRIGVKFYEDSSSFKHTLWNMDQNTMMAASQIAGDFVLPKDPNTKLVFIAGGIGITPFRSMVKYLVDTQEKRDTMLIYSGRTEDDFAYRDVFEAARTSIGLKTLYAVTEPDATIRKSNTAAGQITADRIMRAVPDYSQRVFYLSGTHQMVTAIEKMLLGIGVHRSNIKVDFFPGYA